MTSVSREQLYGFLQDNLQPHRFEDYCPNGLQVEGKSAIQRVITGVTACQALLEVAVADQADAVLVHHGYFWKGESPCLQGYKRRRIATLLRHDINLFAYHLPLDVHLTWGNNAQLAKQLGIEVIGQHRALGCDQLLWQGQLAEPVRLDDWVQHLDVTLARPPQVIAGGNQAIQRVAWCTGAADRLLEQAAALGVDAFISGEISEASVHSARELGIHYLACGHHATERYGVMALAEVLAEQLGIESYFVDIDNPA